MLRWMYSIRPYLLNSQHTTDHRSETGWCVNSVSLSDNPTSMFPMSSCRRVTKRREASIYYAAEHT